MGEFDRIEEMEGGPSCWGKKRRKEGSMNRNRNMNPLHVFGWDIMLQIFNYLDACSLARSLLVCRAWTGIASTDSIWTTKCEELFLGKAHIPRLSQLRGLPKLSIYSLCMMDAKRMRIMQEDLCDHVWEFHFNMQAPEYWINLDPFWMLRGPPMRRYFHPDGSQSADPGDLVYGGHEACYSTVTSILSDGKIRNHYVRINRWPQMQVSRRDDWGWEMSNYLYSYSSIPDAGKDGGTGPPFMY